VKFVCSRRLAGAFQAVFADLPRKLVPPGQPGL
jgi:hypothetical protein